jgi:kumamolisin
MWLTSQQFAQHFAPSATDSAAAKSFLTGAGLHLVASDSPTLLLAQGTTTQVEAAFHTSIADYALPNGSTIYANSSEVAVPITLASKVVAVLGLSNIHVTAPHKQPTRKKGVHYGAGPNGTGLSASQISGIYDIDPVYTKFKDEGKGETIALFEQSNYLPSDIHNYTKAFGLPYTHLVNVPVLGGTSDHSGASETELDIELAVATAPRVNKVLVYESGQTDLETVAQYQKIASDNLADTISTSWGGCGEYFLKSQVTQAENQIFFQMATQGQSMFSATGDYGAFGACPSLNLPPSQALQIGDPNNTPYITAVGGTSFETPSGTVLFDPGTNPHPTYPGVNNEKVWITYPCSTQACNGGGSSGGVSRIWAEGDYAFDSNGNPYPGVNKLGYSQSGAYCGQQPGVLCRENPDVSLNADPGTGYAVYCTDPGDSSCNTTWEQFGGTSCASPIWAGIAALYDEHHSGRQGLFNYIVFPFDSAAGYASQFHDIIGYNNGYYPATPSFDMATGIGTPDVFNFVKS